MRYDSTGRLDQSYGNGGRVVSSFGNGQGFGQAARLQADGKLLVAGSLSYTGTGNEAIVLARYNTNGTFDSNFGAGGFVITGTENAGNAFALQPDGKVVVAGSTSEEGGSYLDFGLARYNGTFELTASASRKTHGAAASFDLDLPLSGRPAVECRATNGSATLVFTFNSDVSSGSVSAVNGTAALSHAPIYAGHTMTVDLSGISNGQTLSMTLNNVTDSSGRVMPGIVMSVSFLLGDSNGDGAVNSGDAVQTRNRSGQATDAVNFRSDLNLDGAVNSGDVLVVRANSGASIP